MAARGPNGGGDGDAERGGDDQTLQGLAQGAHVQEDDYLEAPLLIDVPGPLPPPPYEAQSVRLNTAAGEDGAGGQHEGGGAGRQGRGRGGRRAVGRAGRRVGSSNDEDVGTVLRPMAALGAGAGSAGVRRRSLPARSLANGQGNGFASDNDKNNPDAQGITAERFAQRQARRQAMQARWRRVRRARQLLPPAASASLEKRRASKPQLAVKGNTQTTRYFFYRVLIKGSHMWIAVLYRAALALVIMINVGAFIASTYPQYEGSLVFTWIEGVSSVLYLIEYMLRVWCVIESHHYTHPLWGRLRYVFSFMALLDGCSTFPWFVQLILQNRLLPTLTYLRVFVALRVLKADRHFGAFDSVARVVYSNRDMLSMGLIICFVLTLGTSTLLYYAHRWDEDELDLQFSTLGSTMYLSVLMLTGQGQPDGALGTWTKVVVSITAFIGVAAFSIPAAILAWGFEAEAERLQSRRREQAKQLKKLREMGLPEVLPTSSSSSSSWEHLSTSEDSDSDHERRPAIVRLAQLQRQPPSSSSNTSNEAATPLLQPVPIVCPHCSGQFALHTQVLPQPNSSQA
eukprot:m.487113 g.487113  ORF g.487113 m.487113 type:complete len:569 (-) comp24788_c0_seq1:67-1773(-)